MKLVSNWRKCWKWHSTRIATLIAALPLAWASIPHDLKEYIPESAFPFIVTAMGIAVLIGRLKDQGE